MYTDTRQFVISYRLPNQRRFRYLSQVTGMAHAREISAAFLSCDAEPLRQGNNFVTISIRPVRSF